MSDLRSCCLCDREIDIEAPGTQVFIGGRSKRLTVIDPLGQGHVVTTRYLSERKRNQVLEPGQKEGVMKEQP
jgi:hypothetical protein